MQKIDQQKFELIFDIMQEGVIEQDSEGRILNWNPAALKILDTTAEKIEGKTHLDPKWNPIKRDGSPYPPDEIPSALATKTGQPQLNKTLGLKYPTGIRWLQITAVPFEVAGKNHAIVTFVDITSLIQNSLDLEEKNQKLEKLNQIMVNRELKMQEMKEELALLKKTQSN